MSIYLSQDGNSKIDYLGLWFRNPSTSDPNSSNLVNQMYYNRKKCGLDGYIVSSAACPAIKVYNPAGSIIGYIQENESFALVSEYFASLTNTPGSNPYDVTITDMTVTLPFYGIDCIMHRVYFRNGAGAVALGYIDFINWCQCFSIGTYVPGITTDFGNSVPMPWNNCPIGEFDYLLRSQEMGNSVLFHGYEYKILKPTYIYAFDGGMYINGSASLTCPNPLPAGTRVGVSVDWFGRTRTANPNDVSDKGQVGISVWYCADPWNHGFPALTVPSWIPINAVTGDPTSILFMDVFSGDIYVDDGVSAGCDMTAPSTRTVVVPPQYAPRVTNLRVVGSDGQSVTVQATAVQTSATISKMTITAYPASYGVGYAKTYNCSQIGSSAEFRATINRTDFSSIQGLYDIYATVYDSVGQKATGDVLTTTIQLKPPTITNMRLVYHDNFKATVQVQVDPGNNGLASVKFNDYVHTDSFDDSSVNPLGLTGIPIVVGTHTEYKYDVALANHSNVSGEYSIVCIATDAAGNAVTQKLMFTMSNISDTVALTYDITGNSNYFTLRVTLMSGTNPLSGVSFLVTTNHNTAMNNLTGSLMDGSATVWQVTVDKSLYSSLDTAFYCKATAIDIYGNISTVSTTIVSGADLTSTVFGVVCTDSDYPVSPMFANTNYRLRCQVQNVGNKSSLTSFTSQVYMDGVVIGTLTFPPIAAGHFATQYLSINVAYSGSHTWMLDIDTGKNVAEANKNNNTIIFSRTVADSQWSLPDLVPVLWQFSDANGWPIYNVRAGSQYKLTGRVYNWGLGKCNSFKVDLVCNNQILNTVYCGYIPVGSSWDIWFMLNFACGGAVDFKIVVTDTSGNELNTTNNTATVSVHSIGVLTDLVITSFAVYTDYNCTKPTSRCEMGKLYFVGGKMKNNGSVNTPSFTSKLSTDDLAFPAQIGAVSAGQEVNNIFYVYTPATLGTHKLTYTIDTTGTMTPINASNDTTSVTVNVIPVQNCSLHVKNFSLVNVADDLTPTTIVAGTNYRFRCELINSGNTASTQNCFVQTNYTQDFVFGIIQPGASQVVYKTMLADTAGTYNIQTSISYGGTKLAADIANAFVEVFKYSYIVTGATVCSLHVYSMTLVGTADDIAMTTVKQNSNYRLRCEMHNTGNAASTTTATVGNYGITTADFSFSTIAAGGSQVLYKTLTPAVLGLFLYQTFVTYTGVRTNADIANSKEGRTLNYKVIDLPVPATPVLTMNSDHTIAGITTAMEYSLDSTVYIAYTTTAYAASMAAIAGNANCHTIYVRIAATGTNAVSDVWGVVFITCITPGAPVVTANTATMTITGLTTAMEYSIDTVKALFHPVTDVNAQFSAYETVNVRVAAVNLNPCGSVTSLSFVPVVLTQGYPAVSTNSVNNIITGLTTAMECNLNGAGYVAVTDIAEVFPNGSNVLVRYAAVGTTPCSLAIELMFDILCASIHVTQFGIVTAIDDTIPSNIITNTAYRLKCTVKNAGSDASNANYVVSYGTSVFTFGTMQAGETQSTYVTFTPTTGDIVTGATLSTYTGTKNTYDAANGYGSIPYSYDVLQPVTPVAPVVTGDDLHNVIIGLTTDMEYSVNSGSTYTKATAANAAPTFPGAVTVLVRYAAVGINPCSTTTTCTFITNAVVFDATSHKVVNLDTTMETSWDNVTYKAFVNTDRNGATYTATIGAIYSASALTLYVRTKATINTAAGTPITISCYYSIAPAVDCGINHSVAMSRDGSVSISGSNAQGQFGVGSAVPAAGSATFVKVFSGAKQIVANGNLTLIVDSTGKLWAAGDNTRGGLGFPPFYGSTYSIFTNTISNVVKVATSGDHSVALVTDGTLWLTGRNDFGQCLVSGGGDQHGWVHFTGYGSGFLDVACGLVHTVVLWGGTGYMGYVDKGVRAAGYNGGGQLAVPLTTTSSYGLVIPSPVAPYMTQVSGVAAAGHSSYYFIDGAVNTVGDQLEMYAVGDNSYGQLGNSNNRANTYVTYQALALNDYLNSFSFTTARNFIVGTSGGIQDVGNPMSDTTQAICRSFIGVTSVYHMIMPALVVAASDLQHPTSIGHALYIGFDFKLYSVGNNASGQLGINTTVSAYTSTYNVTPWSATTLVI